MDDSWQQILQISRLMLHKAQNDLWQNFNALLEEREQLLINHKKAIKQPFFKSIEVKEVQTINKKLIEIAYSKRDEALIQLKKSREATIAGNKYHSLSKNNE